MDDIGKIRPERPSTSPAKITPESNDNIIAGATTIALAIIVSAIIGVGGWIGYIEYSAYRIEQQMNIEIQAVQEQARQRTIENARQQEAQRRAREQEQERRRVANLLKTEQGTAQLSREQQAKMRATERREQCEFWQNQLRQNNTQGNRAMVNQWCN